MSTSAQFGRTLREARERRGLTVEQLATETTIPVNHIEALEAGAVDALPRAMYRRAEARAYAEAVGIDPDVILNALRQAPETRPAIEQADARITRDTPPTPSATTAPPATGRAVGAAQLQRLPQSSPPHTPATSRVAVRVGRAVIVLVLGCAALMWEQITTPTFDVPVTSTMTVSEINPVAVIEEAARIAEPPPAVPTMRHVLYEPGIAANGRRWPSDSRLDEGVLVVHSTPRGARVTVNGVGWGVTPVAIRYLPMGTLRVRVGKDDYAVQERVVQLTRETPSRTLRVTLPEVRRRVAAVPALRGDMLVVTSVPAGARVTVNGIGWGTTPLSIPHLPSGAQRVRLVMDQFRSEERVVTVSEDRPGRVAITLKPQS